MASVILKIYVFNLSFQSGVGVSARREGERRSSLTLPTCRSSARIARGRALFSGARGSDAQTDRWGCSLRLNCKDSHISAPVCAVILHLWHPRRVRPRFWSHLKTYLKLPRSCNGIDRGVWSVKQQRPCHQNRDHGLVQVRAKILFKLMFTVRLLSLKSVVSFNSLLFVRLGKL